MLQLFIHEGTVALNKFIWERAFIAISVPAFAKTHAPLFNFIFSFEMISRVPSMSKKISPVVVVILRDSFSFNEYWCNSNSSAGEENIL